MEPSRNPLFRDCPFHYYQGIKTLQCASKKHQRGSCFANLHLLLFFSPTFMILTLNCQSGKGAKKTSKKSGRLPKFKKTIFWDHIGPF